MNHLRRVFMDERPRAMGRLSATFRTGVTAACLALLLGVGATANAQTGVSPNAPPVSSYVGFDETCCGEDPHPVHGAVTPDGGYVLVGKTITANGGWGGFGLKIAPGQATGVGALIDPNENPNYGWSVQIGGANRRSALLSAAATGDTVFFAGLITGPNNDVDMYLAKHASADGRLIWEKRFPDPIARREGAIESIQITADGGLVAAGIVNAPTGGLEGFKSFGNPVGGQAHLFYLSPRQVQANAAPEAPVWRQTYRDYETVKTVREVTGDSPGYVLLLGAEDAPPALKRTDATGDAVWTQRYPGRFEPTDVTLIREGQRHVGYAFTGHGGGSGTLDGQLTRVGLDGAVTWTRSFGDPVGGVGAFAGLGAGNPQLIYDECWGIQGLSDGGVVVACGTGIEGCDPWSRGSAIRAECEADPRTTWRGLLVRFDANGQKVWERVDSFGGANGEAPAAAASEYVFLTPEGGFVSVVDQGFGIGLLITAPESGRPASDGLEDVPAPDNGPEAPRPEAGEGEPSETDGDDVNNAEEGGEEEADREEDEEENVDHEEEDEGVDREADDEEDADREEDEEEDADREEDEEEGTDREEDEEEGPDGQDEVTQDVEGEETEDADREEDAEEERSGDQAPGVDGESERGDASDEGRIPSASNADLESIARGAIDESGGCAVSAGHRSADLPLWGLLFLGLGLRARTRRP